MSESLPQARPLGTYASISQKGFFLEKVTESLTQNSPRVYKTCSWKCITVSTRARHWTVSQASWIHFIFLQYLCLWYSFATPSCTPQPYSCVNANYFHFNSYILLTVIYLPSSTRYPITALSENISPLHPRTMTFLPDLKINLRVRIKKCNTKTFRLIKRKEVVLWPQFMVFVNTVIRISFIISLSHNNGVLTVFLPFPWPYEVVQIQNTAVNHCTVRNNLIAPTAFDRGETNDLLDARLTVYSPRYLKNWHKHSLQAEMTGCRYRTHKVFVNGSRDESEKIIVVFR